MKYVVLIPAKPTVRNMVCCLQSLLNQLNKADKLDMAITGLRINTKTRAIEITTEEESDDVRE